MRPAVVVLNEQHKLLPDQEKILSVQFEEGWEILSVPSDGWDLAEQKQQAFRLMKKASTVVFCSPVPVLLGLCAGSCDSDAGIRCFDVWVMHNDRREKKELPGGKIIQAVAQTGWELICVAA